MKMAVVAVGSDAGIAARDRLFRRRCAGPVRGDNFEDGFSHDALYANKKEDAPESIWDNKLAATALQHTRAFGVCIQMCPLPGVANCGQLANGSTNAACLSCPWAQPHSNGKKAPVKGCFD